MSQGPLWVSQSSFSDSAHGTRGQKEMHAAFGAGLLWKLMYKFWIFARELIFHSRLHKTLTKFYRYVLNETVSFVQQRSYFG